MERKIIEDLLKVVDMLMPGVKHIALQDYKLLNDAPVAARAYLKRDIAVPVHVVFGAALTMMQQDRYDERDFCRDLRDLLQRLVDAGHGSSLLTERQTVIGELETVKDLMKERWEVPHD